MNKRDFLKTGLFGVIGLISIPALAKNKSAGAQLRHREFKLPELPYAYNALEPYISEETLHAHHRKLHAAYTQKLNTALRNRDITTDTAREIMQNASRYDSSLLENCGGFFNHKIYWPMLTPKSGSKPSEDLLAAINTSFGSFGAFKNKFNSAAKTASVSGWTWLISQKGHLKVTSTINQDNPFMNTLPESDKGFPILCIDLWDHASGPQYRDHRSEYVDAFWNVVNWDTVNKRFRRANSR
jgi:superoxide dismutase, Fe-Mn family